MPSQGKHTWVSVIRLKEATQRKKKQRRHTPKMPEMFNKQLTDFVGMETEIHREKCGMKWEMWWRRGHWQRDNFPNHLLLLLWIFIFGLHFPLLLYLKASSCSRRSEWVYSVNKNSFRRPWGAVAIGCWLGEVVFGTTWNCWNTINGRLLWPKLRSGFWAHEAWGYLRLLARDAQNELGIKSGGNGQIKCIKLFNCAYSIGKATRG